MQHNLTNKTRFHTWKLLPVILKYTCTFYALCIFGMVMRWENRSTPTKAGPNANLPTKNHIRPEPELSLGLHGERPANNSLSQRTAQHNITFLHANLKRTEWTIVQGGSNMTGTDSCVNKPHCAAAVRPWESKATTSTLPPARVRTCSVLSGSC